MLLEKVATVTVLRDANDGSFSVHCDFDVHAEAASGFSTIEGVMLRAASIVRDELRARKTIEVPVVQGTGGDGNG